MKRVYRTRLPLLPVCPFVNHHLLQLPRGEHRMRAKPILVLLSKLIVSQFDAAVPKVHLEVVYAEYLMINFFIEVPEI